MDRAEEIKASGFLRSPLCRFVAKLLIFLMMIQGFPLWDLQQSYKWNPDTFSQSLQRFIDIINPQVNAAVSTVFGPKKYIRTTGKPNIYKDTFTAANGRGYLIITNGEEDGKYRISSAIITLNGKNIFKTNDFNQNVYRLRIAVDLLNKNNLIVELRSKPESYLRIEITTASENHSPIADAGHDQTVLMHDMVNLDGSGSTDADGDYLNYKWTFISKPSGSKATLSDPLIVNPTFYIDCAGTYQVQLIVNDGTVDSLPDIVKITTQNSSPVANAGPNQSVFVAESVTLDGSGSTDVDGDTLTFAWSLTSKPATSTAVLSDLMAVKPTFIVDKPGTYVAQLIVNDGMADSTPDTVVITTQNSSPVANAGPDQRVFVTESVTLDGSGSTDVDGDTLTFAWSLTSRPPGSIAILSDFAAVTPTFVVDKFGTYVAQLIVNDGYTNSAPDTVTVTTANSPPVANAGPDQTVFVMESVTLDGSGSSDVDGNILTFIWSLTSRPAGSTATLSDPAAVQPTFVVDKFGTYVAQLIVNDGYTNSAPDTVTITTLNSPPVANAGPDQSVYVTDAVTLDGSGSTDVDGDTLTYAWSLTSRPAGSAADLVNPTAATPTFVVDKFGTYVAQLIVNDGLVSSAPDTVVITTQNSSPVANAGPDQSVFVAESVTLDGSGSSDADGNPLTYSWSFTSMPDGSTAALTGPQTVNPSFGADAVGLYVAQLIVNDGTVNSNPDTVTIQVEPLPNQAPVANSNSYTTDENVALVIGVPGVLGNDTDPDGNTITSSLLTNVSNGTLTLNSDGSFTYTPNINFHGSDAFTYRAYDGLLYSNGATVTITVNHVNHAPVANAGPDQPYVTTGATVTLDGSGSSDTDGDTLTYNWSFVSRPQGSATAFSDPSSMSPTFTADLTGTYVVQLIVNDGSVSSAPDTVETSVGNRPPVATNLSINMAGDTGATMLLRGSDPDGDLLTYSVIVNPFHGTLSGDAPVLTYMPESNYLGQDSFVYRVSDGKGGTADATVSINLCLSGRGLAAHYLFNYTTNAYKNIVDDESGNGNTGTVKGATPTNDRQGYAYAAYSFDGANDYISIANSGALSFANAFTISLWVKNLDDFTRDSYSNYLISKGVVNAPPYNDYVVALTNAYRYFLTVYTTAGTFSVQSTNTFRDNNFHHVVAVYDSQSSAIRLYVDGRLEGSATASGSVRNRNNTFYIGDWNGNSNWHFWKGAIDDIYLYNRAVSELEVQKLYEGCVTNTITNSPPHITSMPMTVGGIGYEYSYQVIAKDPEGDPLTFTIPVAPAGMTIDQAGLIRWTPDTATDFNVSIQVRDSYSGVDTQSFAIRVGEGNFPQTNHAPIAHAGDDFTMDEGKEDELDGSHSYDADGDYLTYRWTQVAGPPVQLDIPTVQKPKFTAPSVSKNTVLTFELVVNDGTVDSPPARVNVMVLNMDIRPDGSGMVVNSNLDGPGSLRAAVEYANAHPGTRITFNIPDTDPGYGKNTPGVWTLPMPPWRRGGYLSGIILEADGTFVDGASQTENQGDRNPYGPEIEITEDTIGCWGFVIKASNIVVRGITLNRPPDWAEYSPTLAINAGENIVISGNYINTDATGSTYAVHTDQSSEYTGSPGMLVLHSSDIDYTRVSLIRNLRIGGSRPGEGNLFLADFNAMIYIRDCFECYLLGKTNEAPGPVTIQGNLIGVDRTGTRALITPRGNTGIAILHGKDVLIGGVTSGSRNVIAAQDTGIQVNNPDRYYQPNGNITIQGNYIGTDATGTASLGTGGSFGIHLVDRNSFNRAYPPNIEWVIGGSIPGAGNVIVRSGGAWDPIYVNDKSGAISAIKVQGNFLGTDATGTRVIGNGASGISYHQGGRVFIGGSGQGEGNVIGGHAINGITVLAVQSATYVQPSFLVIKGNRIGLGADGVTPIPNMRHGIDIQQSFKTIPLTIGGTEPGAGNTIAFNANHGINLGWNKGQMLGNRIFDNGGRGIYRGAVNDPGDANYGPPNFLQNYPILYMVKVEGGVTTVEGFLDTPNPERCLIELFANRTADPSGFGEGEQWVGAVYPQTDGRFGITIPQDLSGKYVTATATRMVDILNSSDFSPAVLVGSSPSNNRPPVISSSPVTVAITETLYNYQVLASDPESQPLRYSLAMAPAGMSITSAGLITWTPTGQHEGAQVVTVVVYDPEGLYASQNFVIQVRPLIDTTPPVVSPSIPSGLAISAPYTLMGTVCDPGLVRYSIEIAPVGTANYVETSSGTTCVQNGALGTIDPTRFGNGLYNLRVTAYDDAGNLIVYNAPEPFEIKGKLKIGQFSLAFQDISVPVSGIPINVFRSYDSFNKKQGDFGIGWDLALGMGVKVQVTRNLGTDWTAEEDFLWCVNPALPCDPEHAPWSYKLVTERIPKVLVTYADGRQDRFEFRPDFFRSSLSPYPALDPRFVQAIYKPLEGTTSKLEAVADTDLFLLDNQLFDSDVEQYNPTEFRLTTADGMVLLISKIEGLKAITDRNGNTVNFSPTGIAHSTGLSISIQRDFKGRVTRVTDPMGRAVSYLYNANDDLAAFTDQAGNVTRFGYDIDHNLTSIIDARGIEIMKTQYDAQGRMIGTVDGLGMTTEVTHDPANATEYVKDRRGYTTVYVYDTDGNITSMADPLGNTTRYTYDVNGNQLTKTDPMGNTWTWTYDANNNKLSETDPLGNTKRWTYNSNNQILTDTDALGRVTAYEYNAKGNLLKKIDPMGNETTYGYDWRGNRTSVTDCFGTTTYEYNGAGHKTKETDALGNVTTYTYDGMGNELTMTRTRTTEAGPVTMVTTKEYDSAGSLTKITFPDGRYSLFEYNAAKQKIAEVDKLGNRTTFIYDAAGNLIKKTFPDLKTELMTYDGNGNRTSLTDRAGHVTVFEYDAVNDGDPDSGIANRLIRTIYADGSTKQVEYDIAGRISGNIDENGKKTSYQYDSAGRISATIDAFGGLTAISYDASGQQTAMTDANGNTTSYERDAIGRTTKTIFADETFSIAQYGGCSAKHKLSETDQAGNTTSFAYDSLGRLIRVTDAMGGQTTYTYDEVGNKLSQTDPNGHTTTWAYDNMGRPTKRTLPLGMSETFTHDANGNVLTKTDFNGNTITYTYDVMNRLTRTTYPNASQVTYTYTSTGRTATVTDFRGTTTKTYNTRDRLTSVKNPDNSTLEYTYDLKGNRTSVKIASGTTSYAYDSLNRLTTVTDPDGNITTYTYDSVGNRSTVINSNGTMTEYQYNALNRLTYLENRKISGEVISSYAYTLGPNGNRTKVTENTGRVFDYTYDTLNRLTQEQITDAVLGSQTIAYTYDAFGNRLTKTDGTGTTTYAYNANDQLITETAPGYTATYDYDLNGNTFRKMQGLTITTYSYDFENRLIGSQTGSQQVTYEYDADGIRMKSTTISGTTKYLVDKNRNYAQVLEERDSGNSLIVSYVYGNNLISQKRGPATSYFHFNGQLSTSQLTDATGATSDTYLYNAFGALIDHSGTTINNYRYSGEQYDPYANLYYLRSRYYQTSTGRFITRDTFKEEDSNPVTLHRYIYGNNNPITYHDPSGRIGGLIESMIVGAIAGILGIFAIASYKGFLDIESVGGKVAQRHAKIYIQNVLSTWDPSSGRYIMTFGKPGNNNERSTYVLTQYNRAHQYLQQPIAFHWAVYDEGVLAYVRCGKPEDGIFLSHSFFNHPLTGYYSQAGTILHEIMHWTDGCAILDEGDYTWQAVQHNARTNPDLAIKNAQNYMFYAEWPWWSFEE